MLESVSMLPQGIPPSNHPTIQSLFRQLDPHMAININKANEYLRIINRMCQQLSQLKKLERHQKKTYCRLATLIVVYFFRMAVEQNKKITDLDGLLGNVTLLLHNLDQEQFVVFSKKIATASYQTNWERSVLGQLTSSGGSTLVVSNTPSNHSVFLSRLVILTIKSQPSLMHHYLNHYLLDTLLKSTDFPLYFLKQTTQFKKLLFLFDKMVQLRHHSQELLCFNFEKLLISAMETPSLQSTIYQSWMKIKQILKNPAILTKLLIYFARNNTKHAQEVTLVMTGRLSRLSTMLIRLSQNLTPPPPDKQLTLTKLQPHQLLLLDQCINTIQKPRAILFQKWQKTNIINNITTLDPQIATIELIQLQCQLIQIIKDNKKYAKLLPINQYLQLIHCLITNKPMNFYKLHCTQQPLRCFETMSYILCCFIQRQYQSRYLVCVYNMLKYCQDANVVRRILHSLETVKGDKTMAKEILMMVEKKEGKCVFMLYSMKHMLTIEEINKIDSVVDGNMAAAYQEEIVRLISNKLVMAIKEEVKQPLQEQTIILLDSLNNSLQGYQRMYRIRQQKQPDTLYMHFYQFTTVIINQLYRLSSATKNTQFLHRLQQCIHQVQSMQHYKQSPITYFSRLQQRLWQQPTTLPNLLLTYTILLDLEQSRRRQFKQVTIDRCVQDMFISMSTTIPILSRMKIQLKKYDISNVTTLQMSMVLRCLEILRNMAHHHNDMELCSVIVKIKTDIYSTFGNDAMKQYEIYKITRQNVQNNNQTQIKCLLSAHNHPSPIVKLSILMKSRVNSIQMWKNIIKQLSAIRRYQPSKPSGHSIKSPYSILKIPNTPLSQQSFNDLIIPYEQSRLSQDMAYCLLPQAIIKCIECMSDNQQPSQIQFLFEFSLRYLSRFNHLQGCLRIIRRYDVIDIGRLFDWMTMLHPQMSGVRQKLFNRRKSMASHYNLDKLLEDIRKFNKQFAKILIAHYCKMHSEPIHRVLEYQMKLDGVRLQNIVQTIYAEETSQHDALMYFDACQKMDNSQLLRLAIFIMDFNYHYKKCCLEQPQFNMNCDPYEYLQQIEELHRNMQNKRRNLRIEQLFLLAYTLHLILPYGRHLLTISVHNKMVTIRKRQLQLFSDTVETFKKLLEKAQLQLRMTKKKADWWKDRERINRDMGRLIDRVKIGPLPQNVVGESQSAIDTYAQSLSSCRQSQFLEAMQQFSQLTEKDKMRLLEQHRNRTHQPEALPNLLYIWPSISIFPFQSTCAESIYRIPAVAYIFQRNFQQTRVNINSLKYLVNPSMDLQNTQDNFRQLKSLYESWQGIIGRVPTSKEYLNLLNKEVFLYMGHGAGSEYITKKEIYEKQPKITTFLFGCSSVKMQQKTSEPCGLALTYLISSCPAVLGCLWDVTDRDTDRCTERIFKAVDQHPTDLSKIVQQSKKQCRMQYLNGCAFVIYGMPCRIYL